AERPPLVARIGVPRRFLTTASRDQLLADFGMDADGVARAARRIVRTRSA
ncbi:MAG: 1-deoxy-D-xylulose-5-phosphate synthase, partial [Actinomyces urogenitalis DORA_12]